MARHATVDSDRLVKTVRIVYKQFIADGKGAELVPEEVAARLGCSAEYVEQRINALRSLTRKANPNMDDEKIVAVYPYIGGKRGSTGGGIKVTSEEYILKMLEDETEE